MSDARVQPDGLHRDFGDESGASVSLCSLRAGPGLFGIDTRKIREVLGATTPQRVPLSPQYISGVVPYRGEVLTTVCFRVLLGLERWSKQRCVLILDDEDEGPFGLAMESVGEVVTIAQDALERDPIGVLQAVRLDPHRLHPSRLAETGLFADLKLEMI